MPTRPPTQAEPDATRARGDAPPRVGRRVWLAVGLLALTALVVLRVRLRRQLLEGAVELELFAPVGAVEAYSEFRWQAAAPESVTYRVYVHDLAGAGPPLVVSPHLDDPRWTPAAPIEAARIRWSVEVWGGGGRRIGLTEAREAWSPVSAAPARGSGR